MTDTIHAAHTLADLDEVTHAEVLARAFWALGNPVRMRIVKIVMEEGEKGVGELVERLPVSQPQVSAHLKCLAECGFLELRKEGRRSLYRVASPWMAGLLSLMNDHAETYLLCGAAGLRRMRNRDVAGRSRRLKRRREDGA